MKMINKNLILILTLALTACSSERPGAVLEKPPLIGNKSVPKSAMQSVKISFNTKAISLDRIKSFDAFLSSNFNDPFAAGANPFGDNVKVQVNNTGATTLITFNNIPPGGPYFAVIAGFDDVIGGTSRNNFTQEDATITSTDKKWARSTNSITVTSSGVVFSDSSTELNINLKLDVFNNVGLIIAPQDGPATSGPVTVSP